MRKPSAKFEYKTFTLGEKLTEEQKEYFKKFGFLGLSKKSLEMCYNQALQARDYVINNLLEVNQ